MIKVLTRESGEYSYILYNIHRTFERTFTATSVHLNVPRNTFPKPPLPIIFLSQKLFVATLSSVLVKVICDPV